MQSHKQVVTPSSLWTEFPQIAHYTTRAGLSGILKSKQLWATQYKSLNDSSEIKHGIKYLNQIYLQTVKSSTQISDEQRNSLLNTPDELERLWFEGLSPNGQDPEIFITSFSGIPDQNQNKNNRLATDGLLSQWRGYGNTGGFAIIFDTSELYKSQLLAGKKCKQHPEQQDGCEECRIHLYAHLIAKITYLH